MVCGCRSDSQSLHGSEMSLLHLSSCTASPAASALELLLKCSSVFGGTLLPFFRHTISAVILFRGPRSLVTLRGHVSPESRCDVCSSLEHEVETVSVWRVILFYAYSVHDHSHEFCVSFDTLRGCQRSHPADGGGRHFLARFLPLMRSPRLESSYSSVTILFFFFEQAFSKSL